MSTDTAPGAPPTADDDAGPAVAAEFSTLLLLTTRRHRLVKSAEWMTAAEIKLELASEQSPGSAGSGEAPAGEPSDVAVEMTDGRVPEPGIVPAAQPGSAPTAEPIDVADLTGRLRESRAAALDAVRAAEVAAEDAYRAVIDTQLLAAELDEATGSMKARRRQGSVARSAARRRSDIKQGVADELRYLLTRKPRTLLKTLLISLASGLLYLGWVRFANWDKYGPWLPFLAVLVVSTIMGGSACVNAMAFDAQRVRDALDRGIRPWQIMVVKNISLGVVVFPVGLLISLMLAWSSGRWGTLLAALIVVITLILLWSGVGNVLSVTLPVRDVSLKRHFKEHTIRTFVVAFGISWAIGYGVNAVLIWRYLAARQLAERWDSPLLAGVWFVAGGVLIWLLLTVMAVAILNQTEFSQRLRLQLLMSQPTTSSLTAAVRPVRTVTAG